jgi:hypothetical protein
MCLTIQKSSFQVSPDLSDESTGFQRVWIRLQIAPSDLAGGGTGVVQFGTGFQRLFHRLPKRSTGLVRWPHRTCLMEGSPNRSFEVGAINRPHLPPRAVGHSENWKTPLRSKALALLSLTKIQTWFLFLREDFSSIWVSHRFKQEHLTPLPRRPLVFVTLGDSIA